MSMPSWREPPPGQWEPQEWVPEGSWEDEQWEKAPSGAPARYLRDPRVGAQVGYDDADPDDLEPGAYPDDGDQPTEPNGGVVAAIVAGGLACAIFGFLAVATAASPAVAKLLTFYWPAGPLTGKSTVTIVAYLVIWPNLHYRLRDRHLDLYKAFLFTLFLIALGLVGTFPPFFQMFEPR